jgi:NAD(P)-dependent dehydrogenase (short-subunit alcohol dehydrogenase family)
MQVLITGGLGVIGRAIARRLEQKGWDVRLIDIKPEAEVNDPRYAMCDIMDFEGLQKQIHGCDAVVHMAALINPLYGTTQDVFRINTAGTFNLFEAAAKAGVRRVVQASSINALGCGFNLVDFVPQYLPVDEDHPSSTTDSYSFSKRMVEDIGAYYWRREAISSIALRFPAVPKEDYYQSPDYYEKKNNLRQMLEELLHQTPEERQRRLEEVKKYVLEYRASRPMEYPVTEFKLGIPEGIDPFLWRAYHMERFYLWAWLDVRDAAQAVEKSLTADLEGSHTLFVNDAYNNLDYDSQTLAELFYPQTPQTLSGSESLVSIQRARDLIGFEPEYSVHGDK